jgi:ribose 5-phosphate isomerase B
MRIAFGTDEANDVTAGIVAHLTALGHEIVIDRENAPWPDVGREVGEAVAAGRADRGVVCCWTGTGVSIAANKVPGVRAALCTDAPTAAGARRWNDANVVALSLRLTTDALAREILGEFLSTDPESTEAENIAKVP